LGLTVEQLLGGNPSSESQDTYKAVLNDLMKRRDQIDKAIDAIKN
jgi:hypothetical protein